MKGLEFTECESTARWFGEWINEFTFALQNNGDYNKYKEYMVEILQIAVKFTKLCKVRK